MPGQGAFCSAFCLAFSLYLSVGQYQDRVYLSFDGALERAESQSVSLPFAGQYNHPIFTYSLSHFTSRMHISFPIMFLACGVAALALPTNTNNNTVNASLISKRWSRPWLDSFDPDDGTCQDADGDTSDDPRPFITAGSCQQFQPATGRVGGSWGAGSGYALSSFWAFENDDCTGAVKAKIARKGGEHGFCFALDSLGCVGGGDLDNPCFWNSVMGNR